MQRRTVLLIRSDACGWDDVRRALDGHPTVAVVGEAMSAHQAVDLAGAQKPNVILSAERIAGVSTLSLLVGLRTRLAPGSRIVVIASRFNPAELDGFAEIGVAAHLLWRDLSTETLGHVLTAVIQGDIVMASRDVASAYLAARRMTLNSHMPPVSLTAREWAVLRCLSHGHTHQQIAVEERISRRTVERVVATLMIKLDAVNEFMLGWKACHYELIDDADRHDGALVSQTRQENGTDSGRRRATYSLE